MWLLDVNILIDAHRRDSATHAAILTWLEGQLASGPPMAMLPDAVVGFLRIVTNPRIYREPDSPRAALAFIDALSSSGVRELGVDVEFHAELGRQIRAVDARAGDVPDAAVAANAIVLGAVLASRDRGFARFPGLSWLDPLEGVVHRNPV